MKESKFPMTEAGKVKLEEELAYLTSKKRIDVVNRIKTARSFCDFTEDSEYEEALKEQVSVEERISSLKNMIYNSEIIKSSSDDQIVSLGKTVTFIEQSTGDVETYTIVGLAEADPAKGLISNQSPLANFLLGKQVNDEVIVHLPGEDVKVKITHIK